MSRTPALPSRDEPVRSLAPQHLHDELKEHIKDYEHLHPLSPLLESAFHPREQIQDLIEDSLKGIKQERDPYSPAHEQEQQTPSFIKSTEIFEEDGKTGVLYTSTSSQFNNWGKTISHSVSYMFEPHTIEGVRNIVKWAAKHDKRVRCAGFRHTWTDLFGADGDVLVMLQPFTVLTSLPYHPPGPTWHSQFQGVSIVDSVAGKTAPEGHGFVKIMAGTSNDFFRQWCFDNKTLFIPFNVIMVEVTFGGTNAPICHGSGLSSSTLSDLVVEISYVDANGDLQTVTDVEELKAASGCFGLLGVVVSVTLKLDKMARAELQPIKQHYALAIPPPKGYPLPKEVEEDMQKLGITELDFEKARQEFIEHCENDYYLEWFWFPYQRYVWTNCWKKYELTATQVLQAYPGKGLDGVQGQWVQEKLAESIIDWWAWKKLGGYQQAFLFGCATLAILPNITDPEDRISTYTSEALHFRRGIQNFRVWDTEWEIPIPAKPDGKRNYDTVQRAWWDGITAIYSRPDAPVRVALEMRLTGGSDVLLAAQRGNDLGSISIEVLTTLTTPKEDWKSFCQQMADIWTDGNVYKDKDGKPLNVRPHWAKQWEGLSVRGKPVEQYLKEDAYPAAFAEFRHTMEGIVSKRGSSIRDTRKRFGNDLMERLIWA